MEDPKNINKLFLKYTLKIDISKNLGLNIEVTTNQPASSYPSNVATGQGSLDIVTTMGQGQNTQ